MATRAKNSKAGLGGTGKVIHNGYGGWTLLCGIIALIVAGMLHVRGSEDSLAASTYVLAGFILFTVILSWVWGALADTIPQAGSAGTETPDMTTPVAQTVNLYLVVASVVLGLVFTFAFITGPPPTDTIKVAAGALGFAVLVGLMLYSLVVVEQKGAGQSVVTRFLFTLMTWALAYGLICVAAAVIARP